MFLLASLPLAAQNLEQGRLLYYPFDGNANDAGSNHYNGTPSSISYGADRDGNPSGAAYFNGISSYVNLPNIAALKPQFPLSFSFWINYQSEDFHQQVVFNTSFEENRCTGVWFNSSLSNNGHAINFGDGTYAYSPETRRTFLCVKEVATFAWHQVVVIVNSATDMKIYIDCVPAPGNYSGFGGDLVYSATPGTIGRHDRYLDAPPDYFKGLIDDFMYWNRALTLDEVNELCEESLFAVEDFAQDKNLMVYPNPASGELFIESLMPGEKTVNLYNNLGQQILSRELQSPLDVSGLAPGIYLLQLRNAETVVVKKVVIR